MDSKRCIICPNACELTMLDGKVTGNKCIRGIEFMKQEMICPKRVITTTIPYVTAKDTLRIPVRTEDSVELLNIQETMDKIHNIVLYEKPAIGSLIEDQGVRLVVTGE